MSAYIVAEETINRIANAIEFSNLSYRTNSVYPTSLIDLEHGNLLVIAHDAAELAQDMHAMNIEAVSGRYEDDAVEELPGMATDKSPYLFRHIFGLIAEPAQVLKSLDCYLYQCSEGDVPKRPLYIALSAYRDQLVRNMAKSTPEYKAAVWG